MWEKNNAKNIKTLNESELRNKCIDLLSRREYSYKELKDKLLPLTEDESLVSKAIDWMVAQRYQSDERFAIMYVRSKAMSGYGPIRIKLELNQKGIDELLIEKSFEENSEEISWTDQVDRLILKKSKNIDITDFKSRSKVMGYLQRKGFSIDQIYQGLDRYKEEMVIQPRGEDEG
jgi:regulatory protein